MAEKFIEKSSSRRRFSSTIENILKECHALQNPPIQSLSRHMESQLSRLNLIYDQISNTDLNPMKFEASRAYQNGKKRLTAYLREKNRLRDSMNKDRLNSLLTSDYPKTSMEKLSFDSFREVDVSYLVMKNKRKFGEGYAFKGFSACNSPQNSMLPSLTTSPKGSPLGCKKNNKLNNIITSMIDKKLGILPRKRTILPQKKIVRPLGSKSVLQSPLSIIEVAEKQESQYLNPEFRKLNSNIEHNLKIQKLIVNKHAKDRRMTIQQLGKIKIAVENSEIL